MGDEEDTHAGLRTQFVEEVEDALLHGDVERRGRFVGDERPRPQRDACGDEHALAHPAGEFVRVLIGPQFGTVDADALEEVEDLGASGAAIGPPVDARRLGDGPAHGLRRVEGAPGSWGT